jgi:hypothetical protein
MIYGEAGEPPNELRGLVGGGGTSTVEGQMKAREPSNELRGLVGGEAGNPPTSRRDSFGGRADGGRWLEGRWEARNQPTSHRDSLVVVGEQMEARGATNKSS